MPDSGQQQSEDALARFGTSRNWGLKAVLLVIIALTIPFYLVGGLLLIVAPNGRNIHPPTSGPTLVPTKISLKSTIVPTETLGPPTLVSVLLPTPMDLPAPTPTALVLDGLVLQNSSAPNPNPAPGSDGSGGSGGSSLPLCADFNGSTTPIIRVDAAGAVPGGVNIYCKTLTDHNQIGIQSVIDRGIVVAVDIFALNVGASVTHFSKPINVCLQGSGIFLYLDANNSPRTVAQPPANGGGGYTCASVPNAGIVALVSH